MLFINRAWRSISINFCYFFIDTISKELGSYAQKKHYLKEYNIILWVYWNMYRPCQNSTAPEKIEVSWLVLNWTLILLANLGMHIFSDLLKINFPRKLMKLKIWSNRPTLIWNMKLDYWLDQFLQIAKNGNCKKYKLLKVTISQIYLTLNP